MTLLRRLRRRNTFFAPFLQKIAKCAILRQKSTHKLPILVKKAKNAVFGAKSVILHFFTKKICAVETQHLFGVIFVKKCKFCTFLQK